MKGKEICEVIKDYIENSPYPYAIMIDGAWGCGKSHFVKHELKDYIEKIKVKDSKKQKNFQIINISLYGVSSVKEISEQIVTHLVFRGYGETGKFLINTTSTFLSSLSEKYLGKDFIPFNSEKRVLKKLRDTVDTSPYIFVFDDLERCQISINETLGYINNLVENNSAKVIIIANEKEIASVNIEQNKELKYLLCVNDTIEYPSMPIDTLDSLASLFQKTDLPQEQGKVNSLSLSEIQFRLNFLFGTDELYKMIKEKLIRLTIRYEPELSIVVPELIMSALQEENQIISDTIINQIKSSDFCNLRVVQNTLSFYKKLIEQLPLGENCEVNDEMKRYIIRKSIQTAITVAKGKDFDNHENSDVRKYIDDVIEKYFCNGSFVLEDVKSALGSLLLEITYQIDKKRNPINFLQSYYDFSEQDVRNYYKDFYKCIKQNKYESELYPKILGIICDLKKLEILDEDEFNKVFNIMKTNVENGITIDQYWGIPYTQISSENKVYEEYYQQLYEIKKKEQSFGDTINNILISGDGWGSQLDKFIIELPSNEKIVDLLCIIDIDQLIDILYRSKPKDIANFRGVILHMYKHTENEKEKIKSLLDKIDFSKSIDKICALQLYWLKSNLEKVLKGM